MHSTTPLPHPPGLMIAAGLVLIVVMAAALMFASRVFRAGLALDSTSDGRTRAGVRDGGSIGARSAAAGAPLPTGVARTLASRGLVNGQQLASMSPAEREFFLSTVAGKLGDGTKPRLVGQGGAGAAEPIELIESLPPAALVSGAIHCPVCRTPVGQRTDTPLRMARCPGCSRRIGMRVEGERLTVTVDYTLRTPAAGVGKVNG